MSRDEADRLKQARLNRAATELFVLVRRAVAVSGKCAALLSGHEALRAAAQVHLFGLAHLYRERIEVATDRDLDDFAAQWTHYRQSLARQAEAHEVAQAV